MTTGLQVALDEEGLVAGAARVPEVFGKHRVRAKAKHEVAEKRINNDGWLPMKDIKAGRQAFPNALLYILNATLQTFMTLW